MKIVSTALSQKQLMFIEHYLKGTSAQASAIAAGYSTKGAGVQGHQLLNNTKVSAEIKKRQESLAKQSQWTREDSVRELKAVIDKPDKKSDVTAAIKELNLMHGYNAPTKIEHSGLIQSISRTIIDPAKAN